MSKLKKCIFIVNLLKMRGRLTRQEINKEMRKRWPYEQELSRSSFGRYLDFISENFPYYVSFSQVTKQYSIDYRSVNNEDEELFQYLLSMYNIEASAPLLLKHKDRIHHIESLTGTDKLDIIMQAIDEQRGIECNYQSFNQATKKHRIFIPVFITSWEGRWYCVAEVTTHPESKPYTYALERMSDIHLTSEHYTPRYVGTYHDYFKDCYGIQAASPTDEPQDIIIKALGARAEYLRAKPLHPSQVELTATESPSLLESADGEAIFRLHLTPCFNFYQQILHNREDIEVLEPQTVREEIKRITSLISNKYR